jgi:hypothetical protein
LPATWHHGRISSSGSTTANGTHIMERSGPAPLPVALRQEFRLDSARVHSSYSIGTTLPQPDITDSSAQRRQADSARARAKEPGCGVLALYSST